jgi:hypothetical protein
MSSQTFPRLAGKLHGKIARQQRHNSMGHQGHLPVRGASELSVISTCLFLVLVCHDL